MTVLHRQEVAEQWQITERVACSSSGRQPIITSHLDQQLFGKKSLIGHRQIDLNFFAYYMYFQYLRRLTLQIPTFLQSKAESFMDT